MNKLIIFFILTILISSCGENCLPYPPDIDCDKMRISGWAKVNTHTHTTLSDGKRTPEEVITWYKDHCYDALIITDHAFWYNTPSNNLLIISGIEYSYEADYVYIDKDISILAHPQRLFDYNLSTVSTIINTNLFEVFNGGDSIIDVRQNEILWDTLLLSGILSYGIAADDAHFNCETRPGRGWIMVETINKTQEEILNSIKTGKFYATTGVYLLNSSEPDFSRTDADLCNIETILIGSFERKKITCTKGEKTMTAWEQPYIR